MQGIIPEIKLQKYIYLKEGAQGAEHLFRVCCGAKTVHLPLVKIEKYQELTALDKALNSLNQYDWIVFTSVDR